MASEPPLQLPIAGQSGQPSRGTRILAGILAPLACVAALAVAGVIAAKLRRPASKSGDITTQAATPAPAPAATPAPASTPAAAPTPAATPVAAATPQPSPAAAVKSDSVVSVLGYHRFENPPRDALAISTRDFEAQMQRLKDQGIAVISMTDFLAWRRGEKALPPRAAVITIDDGYVSGYTEAWPILKKFGYPFTMFVYTKYISAGGKSITWAQLAEMRDAGVDIGSHTVSHDRLTAKKNRTDADYDAWLWNEFRGSKDQLEQQLGVAVRTLAFPYGMSNEHVRAIGMKAGYEALFTVNGIKTHQSSPPSDAIGRYIVDSTLPKVFEMAATFGPSPGAPVAVASAAPGPRAPSAPSSPMPATSAPAAGGMLTQPAEGETIQEPRPLLKANLAALGKVDPKSVEMQLTGFGPVPCQYDPATGLVTYQVTQKIRERACTVTVSATVGGKKVSTHWTFYVEPAL